VLSGHHNHLTEQFEGKTMLSKIYGCHSDLAEHYIISTSDNLAVRPPYALAAGYFGCMVSTTPERKNSSSKWQLITKEVKGFQARYISSVSQAKAA
jgi:hypothetical protein